MCAYLTACGDDVESIRGTTAIQVQAVFPIARVAVADDWLVGHDTADGRPSVSADHNPSVCNYTVIVLATFTAIDMLRACRGARGSVWATLIASTHGAIMAMHILTNIAKTVVLLVVWWLGMLPNKRFCLQQ